MGGSGSSSGKGGGGGASASQNIQRTHKRLVLSTDKERREVLRSMTSGDELTIVNDYSDLRVRTQSDSKKLIVSESGIKYNSDGSYTPYNKRFQATEATVVRYMNTAKSIRIYK